MDLTVSDLAFAVNKSEGFVRKRIRQNDLSARRDGRRLFIAPHEAARWARESGLSFVLRVPNPERTGIVQCRIARLTVLAWHPKDRAPVNLFTHIRHRRYDALEPWVGDKDESWSCHSVSVNAGNEPGELRLYRLDGPLEHCQVIVDGILATSVLNIGDQEIWYSLHQDARRFWAYRDLRGASNFAVTSPFDRYSAEVLEFWSFDDELREVWRELLKLPQTNLEALIQRLKFPLDRRSERVGNLMIAGAEDGIVCDIHKHQHKSLLFRAERANGTGWQFGQYTASVWANHGDSRVLQRDIGIVANETVIDLVADVDQIGFALYRESDGQCIDMMDVQLSMGINFAMHMDAGPNVMMHDRKRSATNQVSLGSRRYMVNVDTDKYSNSVDRMIRQWVLDRRAFELGREARRAGNLARFGPGQLDKAVEHFLDLLRRHTYSEEPIYLADPFFMKRRSDGRADRLYIGIFQTTMGRPLRIICGRREGSVWWSNYPPGLIGHATVRSFTKNDASLFHDRFLVTSEQEILISNSISGWNSDGVTFAALPYGVYREEAEALWAMHVGEHSDGTNVWDVK